MAKKQKVVASVPTPSESADQVSDFGAEEGEFEMGEEYGEEEQFEILEEESLSEGKPGEEQSS